MPLVIAARFYAAIIADQFIPFGTDIVAISNVVNPKDLAELLAGGQCRMVGNDVTHFMCQHSSQFILAPGEGHKFS